MPTTLTANVVTCSLPANTTVGLLALTNAAYEQKITIQIGSYSPIVFTGHGEGNHVIGQQNVTTPNGAAVPCTIKIEHQVSGTWTASSSTLASYVTSNLRSMGYVVASEDATDNDFNDAMLWITFSSK